MLIQQEQTTNSGAQDTEVAPETKPETKAEYRKRFLEKNGLKSFGDYAPKAEEIRAQYAPKPRVEEQPVEQEQKTESGDSEVQKLRLELAELKGKVSAQPEAKPEPKEEVAKPDPLENPYRTAAAQALGEDAPEYLLDEASELVQYLRRWEPVALSGDDKQQAEAKRNIAAIKKRLSAISREADREREVRALKSEIEKLKNPDKGISDAVSQAKARLFDKEAAVIAQYFPRLGHALGTKQISREKVEARIDKVQAKTQEEWLAGVEAVLADLDDLYPDPPKQEQPTKTAPKNVASISPRPRNGHAAPREQPQTKREYREALKDRWRSVGPINKIL